MISGNFGRSHHSCHLLWLQTMIIFSIIVGQIKRCENVLHATKLSLSSRRSPNSILCGDIGTAEGTGFCTHPRQSIVYGLKGVRRHVSRARANSFHSISSSIVVGYMRFIHLSEYEYMDMYNVGYNRIRSSFVDTNSLRHLRRRSCKNCDQQLANRDRFKENYSIHY